MKNLLMLGTAKGSKEMLLEAKKPWISYNSYRLFGAKRV